jgi:hypothetical protein
MQTRESNQLLFYHNNENKLRMRCRYNGGDLDYGLLDTVPCILVACDQQLG